MGMPSKRRLLIADDDPSTLAALEISMTSDAWEIETAADALQALIKARDIKPFCILTDVQMPAYGKGTDMLRALRMEKAIADTPVILLTGMELDRVKKLVASDDPRVRIMSKPPNFPQLFAVIKELTGVEASAK